MPALLWREHRSTTRRGYLTNWKGTTMNQSKSENGLTWARCLVIVQQVAEFGIGSTKNRSQCRTYGRLGVVDRSPGLQPFGLGSLGSGRTDIINISAAQANQFVGRPF